jgi:hypothetical protein
MKDRTDARDGQTRGWMTRTAPARECTGAVSFGVESAPFSRRRLPLPWAPAGSPRRCCSSPGRTSAGFRASRGARAPFHRVRHPHSTRRTNRPPAPRGSASASSSWLATSRRVAADAAAVHPGPAVVRAGSRARRRPARHRLRLARRRDRLRGAEPHRARDRQPERRPLPPGRDRLPARAPSGVNGFRSASSTMSVVARWTSREAADAAAVLEVAAVLRTAAPARAAHHPALRLPRCRERLPPPSGRDRLPARAPRGSEWIFGSYPFFSRRKKRAGGWSGNAQ